MSLEKIFKSRLFSIICTITLTATFIFFILPYISEETSKWGTAEIAIVISIVAILAQIAPPFIQRFWDSKNKKHHNIIKDILEKQTETYYAIKLDVDVLADGNVQFEATICNEGLVTILPQYTKLYIDQGIEGSGDICGYDFPFILEHKGHNEENDCILCNRCKAEQGRNSFPIDVLPEKFRNELRDRKLEYGCFSLDHLSEKSIKYIRAHEQFQENLILKFKKSGVFRATLVVITKNADCQCATEQFYVSIKP
ncbi:MAG: hypothetical protein IJX01_00495 [Oscillospiraceae bacterium]|nr:hypothetical protein [Oscillospiraceae bacterium]